MEFGSLWLPVVVSAVAVFVLSSIAHMVLPYHRADYKKLPDEDAAMDLLRNQAAGPGLYMFPNCGKPEERNDPAFKEKLARGPVGLLAILPGGVSMGKSLGLWFLHCFLVSFFTGYVGRHALMAGDDFVTVMRATSTVAAAAYVLGPLPGSIWGGYPWSYTLKGMADGVAYALATGAVFAWRWPA